MTEKNLQRTISKASSYQLRHIHDTQNIYTMSQKWMLLKFQFFLQIREDHFSVNSLNSVLKNN